MFPILGLSVMRIAAWSRVQRTFNVVVKHFPQLPVINDDLEQELYLVCVCVYIYIYIFIYIIVNIEETNVPFCIPEDDFEMARRARYS